MPTYWGFLARLTVRAVFVSVMLGSVASAQVPEPGPTYGDAIRWYQRAADAGDARAQFLLGVRYETGTGVDADLGKAAVWYGRAAAQGHPEAQFKLAVMTAEGRGVTQDVMEAAGLYEQAAEAGLAVAQYNLGVAYLNGTGVAQDIAEAYGWVAVAADQDLAAAVSLRDRLDGSLAGEMRAAAESRADALRARL